MKKIFKWIAIVIGSLITIVTVAAIGLSFSVNALLNKTYTRRPCLAK